jgi:hypothetical protein
VFNAIALNEQEEWEKLGLEKRIDYDNLKRVFERLDTKEDKRIDQEELSAMYKVGSLLYFFHTYTDSFSWAACLRCYVMLLPL